LQAKVNDEPEHHHGSAHLQGCGMPARGVEMTTQGQAVFDNISHELDVCFKECWATHQSNPPSQLFHYTSTEGLVGIVSGKRFFLSDMLASTDQLEIRYGFDIIRQVLEQSKSDNLKESLLATYKEFETLGVGRGLFVFAICFCAEDDVLTQWRGYSPAGGFAIGVDFKELMQLGKKQEFAISRMLYEKDAQRQVIERTIDCARRLLPKLQAAAGSNTSLLDEFIYKVGICLFRSSLLFKHHKFDSEKEWRFFAVETSDHHKSEFRTRANGITPYIELSFESELTLIRQIRCSPGLWSRSARYGVERLAKSLGEHVLVDQSDLPL
jgi:hypothetical protein